MKPPEVFNKIFQRVSMATTKTWGGAVGWGGRGGVGVGGGVTLWRHELIEITIMYGHKNET